MFHDGRRVAIVGTLCHHLDVGGMSPGSYAAGATEIYQEGLAHPAGEAVRGGRRNDALWSVIGQNVRQAATVMGDLQSQIASLDIGAQAIARLAAKYGAAHVGDGLPAVARRVRSRHARLHPPHARRHLRVRGLSRRRRHRSRQARAHPRASVDDRGRPHDRRSLGLGARKSRGPINATLASSSSAVYFAAVAAADRPIAANAGCYRPVEIIAPEGLIVSARHPAPVAHRIAPCHVLLNVLFGALSKAIPDRMPAAAYGVSYVCSFQTHASDGTRNVLVEIEVGGCGAHPDGDGASAHSFGMHNNASIPIEMIESDMPVTYHGLRAGAGSGGAGRHRGGLGLTRSWRIDADTATFTAQMDRFRFRPFGLHGGGPGAPGRLVFDARRQGAARCIPRSRTCAFSKGDIIRLVTSGGGGLGPAHERSAASRAADRAAGYIKS